MIPVCDLKQQYLSLKAEIDAALLAAVEAGQYILGPNVKTFEQEAAQYLDSSYAVGVGNGTDALTLALRALDIGPGDEVITTPFTFIATAEAVSLVGACPVFVDIDPHTWNIDPNLIEQAISPQTKAIIPVHLYGQPCEMDAIMDVAGRRGLKVIEDCAQAMGATYRGRQVGTFGDFGCYSFFPSKNLGTMGDGGMIATSDKTLYERVETLRRHGGRVKYHHEEVGTNSRLDELHAAILRVKLPHLDKWNSLRRRNAYRYNALLKNVGAITCPAEWDGADPMTPATLTDVAPANPTLRSVYHQYTILVDDRDAAIEQLKRDGVASMIYYPVPLHRQKVYESLGYGPWSFPIAEAVAARCMSLPMFPELTMEQQQHIAASLSRFVEQHECRSSKKAA